MTTTRLISNLKSESVESVQKALTGKNYYELLELNPDATEEDIKKAFLEFSKKVYPDKVVDPENKKVAEEIFKHIQKAYETLSDKQKRPEYDQTLNNQAFPATDAKVSHVYDSPPAAAGAVSSK